MAEDEKKPTHAIFGSAGMAAAGMIRHRRAGEARKEPQASPPADGEEENTTSEVETHDLGSDLPSDDAPHIEFATDLIEPEPERPAPRQPEPDPDPAPPKHLRAAVIGHTGSGNYGHGLDQLFQRLDGVRLVSIADADPEGLDAAQIRTGAETTYGDFREMLASESPELVAVAPRWNGERHAMVMAALEAGAHVCVERPIARTLREADELLALAGEKERKIAVLHPMRLDPHVVR